LPDDAKGTLHTLLSADEIERSERFRFEHLRAHYISRHAALRLLLARYLQASPTSLLLVPEANGRPILANPPCRMHFNLSHSGDVALVAASSIAPVGVDVEEVRNVPNFLKIARDHFAATEVEDLLRSAAEKRLSSFFVTWTRKEAFVKALGLGLSFPLDAFSTGRPDHPPLLRLGGTRCTDWTMVDLVPSRRHTVQSVVSELNGVGCSIGMSAGLVPRRTLGHYACALTVHFSEPGTVGNEGSVIRVARARGMPSVRCALSKASTKALEKWITTSGKKRADYLFPGRGVEGRRPMGARQLNRLLKDWAVEAGLDPSDYGVVKRLQAMVIARS
jgi:4'-phosphopantetheinyl transferase